MMASESEEFAKGKFCVYQRFYRPSEKRYDDTLFFYKSFDTYEEANRVVKSNPQKYIMSGDRGSV